MSEKGEKKRVVVAMSGGVDSSVAAAVLKEQGYEVIGVTMQLWDHSGDDESASGATTGSCCSLEDIADARRVADELDIPFYVLNMEAPFLKEVVDYFVSSYLEGRTPNPCIKCNHVMKFDLLLAKALALEADYIATGHYARISRSSAIGPYLLKKGVDANKDQSYFLFTLRAAQLDKILFPLGAMTKREVRRRAASLGLRTADKQESQEICFITDGAYSDFVASRASAGAFAEDGDIVDLSGNQLGRHTGLFRYTIGQRKGLNLAASGKSIPGMPDYSTTALYVLAIDVENNRLVVGPERELFSDGLVASGFNWVSGAAPSAGAGSSGKVFTKIRYRHPGVEATLGELGHGRVEIRFKSPQKAVTPGQAAVVYSGDTMLGGGWIERAL